MKSNRPRRVFFVARTILDNEIKSTLVGISRPDYGNDKNGT